MKIIIILDASCVFHRISIEIRRGAKHSRWAAKLPWDPSLCFHFWTAIVQYFLVTKFIK